jgi:hypothetical protein
MYLTSGRSGARLQLSQHSINPLYVHFRQATPYPPSDFTVRNNATKEMQQHPHQILYIILSFVVFGFYS